jgi:TonB family protein
VIPVPDWSWLESTANHLWQSTLVAALAALLILICRKSEARVRYWLAMAASLKFLVPFAALVAIGSWMPWPAAFTMPRSAAAMAVGAIGEPFSLRDIELTPFAEAAPERQSWPESLPNVVLSLWVCGSVGVVVWRWARWRQVAEVLRRARTLSSGREVTAWRKLHARLRVSQPLHILGSEAPLGPCVVGLIRPVLLWPARLADRLADRELEAILTHELSHARSRHNLASLAHMAVEAVFWFHPLVWWIGGRLVVERERACDEDVLRRGSPPAAYAEGILKVCKFCMESRLACLSSISGSTLNARIEAIMTHRIPPKLGRPGRLLFIAAGVTLLAAPLAAGVLRRGPTDAPLPSAIAPFVNSVPPSAQVEGRQADTAPRGTRPASNIGSGFPLVAVGQTAVPSSQGRISGVVTDQSGRSIADASVTISAASTGDVVKRVASDPNGQYAIDGLASGTYALRVEHDGFRPASSRVEVRSGTSVVADVSLRLGSVAESITVTPGPSVAGAPESSPSDEAELVAEITRDPQSASNYLALARLYYRQERFTESERMIDRAVDLIELQATSNRPAAMAAGPSGGDIKPPRLIRAVPPVYPSSVSPAEASNLVVLEATVSAAGTVKDARVVRGESPFDQAALGAVRQWLYTPTLLNGVPMDVSMTVNVTFTQK